MSTTPSARATSSDARELLPTLTLSELACRRGNRVLFRGVNLAVRPGQATWLRGRNGRGKTSLLRLAAGLAVPESGKILWGDTPVRAAPHYAPRRVFIGHANALKDDLTVTESLTFLAQLHARSSDAAHERTQAWLGANAASVGQRSSADIAALFGNHEQST